MNLLMVEEWRQRAYGQDRSMASAEPQDAYSKPLHNLYSLDFIAVTGRGTIDHPAINLIFRDSKTNPIVQRVLKPQARDTVELHRAVRFLVWNAHNSPVTNRVWRASSGFALGVTGNLPLKRSQLSVKLDDRFLVNLP
jgi:hypothetical protein